VLKQYEERGEYGKAAALAVWHDDISAAVSVLRNGAEMVRNASGEKQDGGDNRSEKNYDVALDLVSMCVAGYTGPNAVWNKACSDLLRRQELLAGGDAEMKGASYVRSMLKFLLATGPGTDQSGPKSVIEDSALCLCDRIAFCCRFLPRADLKDQLKESIATCQKNGDIEGVVITGISQDGFKILQAYVDKVSDVQTAALVSSRVALPTGWSWERKVCPVGMA